MKVDNKDIIYCYKAMKIAEVIANELNNLNCKEKNQEIVELLNENSTTIDFFVNFSSDEFIKEKSLQIEEINIDKDKNIAILLNDILKVKKRKLYSKIVVLSSSIAAAILLAFIILQPTKDSNVVVNNYIALETIPKTTNDGPILILESGESVSLNKINNSITISQDLIVKNNQNSLDYSDVGVSQSVALEYNTLIIPKMDTYKIILEDGTKVTFNANSEFRYPVKFVGDKRIVYLSGEAFFDVAKGDKPFIVNSNGVEIRVYGTQFNVNSYNSSIVKTSLISGLVGVSYLDESGLTQEVIVKPNQLSIVDLNNKTSKLNKVSEDCTSWMTGYLSHYSGSLESYLEKLSMWYGVDFYFEKSEHKAVTITCSFSNSSSLDEILSSLEQTTDLIFAKRGDFYVVE